MKLARYLGGGKIAIVDEPSPTCPTGGILVKTEACGLCTGELMDWYMDRKVPHVLGHEVTGKIVESQDPKFPVGHRVFTHHHAPCGFCDFCRRKAYVHCPQWKATRLDPGGMAESYAVSKENLNDAFLVDKLDARDAALIEPLGCVAKSLNQARYDIEYDRPAVVGLGFLGVAHALVLKDPVAYELDDSRREYAKSLGIDARHPNDAEPESATCVIVCPGSPSALDLGLKLAARQSRVNLFAPLPPGEHPLNLEDLYFRDITLSSSYSCGPEDTLQAFLWLAKGKVDHHRLVTDLVTLDQLPDAYRRMKNQETLKSMVVFGES